jgi:putative membrane protein insertion efficiency factor
MTAKGRASWTAMLDRGVVALLTVLIRTYQQFLSPFLGPTCRFRPTCSVYFLESLKSYGAVRGSLRGLRRICRCHPWSRGGWDPP